MPNFSISNVRIQLKNDTATNWKNSTLVPLKGELCLESDTGRFKFGDGTHKYSEIENYGGTIVTDSTTNGNILVDGTEVNVYTLPGATTGALGGVKSVTGGAAGTIAVDENGAMTLVLAPSAVKLETPHNFSITGDDVTATAVSFDGTGDVTLASTLRNVGTSGTYVKVTTDAKGRVTSGTTAADFKATDSSLGLVQGHTVSETASENIDKVFVDNTGKLSIQEASKAAKLTTPRTISVSGAATGSTTFDGSDDASIALTLTNSGVSAGKYKMATVTVNEKGLVTAIEKDALADLDIATDTTPGLVLSSADTAGSVGHVTVDSNGVMTVAEAPKATILTNQHAFSINAGKTTYGTANINATAINFNGSGDVDLAADLTDTGVTTGTYTKVTVDAKGRVTQATNIATADVTDAINTTDGTSANAEKAIKTDSTGELNDNFLKSQLAASTDETQGAAGRRAGAYTVANVTVDIKGRVTAISSEATTTEGGSGNEGKLLRLNSNGKLNDSVIPALAIGEVHDYTSKAEAFNDIANVQSGDIAVITNTTTPTEDGVYICRGEKSPANFDAAYTVIKVPGTAIQSVNTKVGPHVVLITDDIAEDSNTIADENAGNASDTHKRYYTQARVAAYTQSTNVEDMFDNGDDIMLLSKNYVIDCGTSSTVNFEPPAPKPVNP